jgi:SAM-dependent MidA family methyltransferase
VADELGARLRRRIEDSGPITFADFMEAALYEPGGGFFEGGGGRPGSVVGSQGDFVTSPHVSAMFGMLMARLVEKTRELLDRPPVFTVVEVGAGDGTLAADLVASLPHREAIELALVERTAAHRTRLATLLPALPIRARLVGALSELAPRSVVGCLVANELVDNLSFHRVRRGPAGPVELYVGLDDGHLALVEGPPSSSEVADAARRLEAGQEGLLPAGARAFLAEAAVVLDRGYVVLIDYPTDAPGEPGAVHGYRAHHPVSDVLARPGLTDVTAGVDFEALAEHAGAVGFRSWGTVTQRDLLQSLGYRGEMDRMLCRQAELLNGGRGAEAARMFAERSRAGLLIDPAGLGGFRALCLSKGASRAPRPWGSGHGGGRPG